MKKKPQGYEDFALRYRFTSPYGHGSSVPLQNCLGVETPQHEKKGRRFVSGGFEDYV
jgi:hypothetical protein